MGLKNIADFHKGQRVNGKTDPKPDMEATARVRRSYRGYLFVALALATALAISTIVLAVLLHNKIHKLDRAEDDLEECRGMLIKNSPTAVRNLTAAILK
ncbi:unnamed protein product [Cylicocyclus nassatus]|uniref:Uncharacterized protein n=1 Tax=Cylicocyclus nassatus TaxID=53992 RepID=A0AA36DS83_CYLNA|nr:unnamed protein product [Cylicocyclus nassatus]